MGKKIVLSVDNFAQSGESTLAEVAAVAAGQSGNAAEVVRDPATGKVIQVNVNLPDTASQSAIDAILANKGAAGGLVFPNILLDEDFDAVTVGQLPPNDTEFSWFTLSGTVNVQADQAVSGANSLKLADAGAGVLTNVRAAASASLADFTAVGRTLETELQVRWTDAAEQVVITPGGTVDMNFFIVGGNLRAFIPTGTIIVGSLAINTFHKIKFTQVMGTDTVAIEVNGTPHGNFTTGNGPSTKAWESITINAFNPDVVHVDDLKVTSVA